MEEEQTFVNIGGELVKALPSRGVINQVTFQMFMMQFPRWHEDHNAVVIEFIDPKKWDVLRYFSEGNTSTLTIEIDENGQPLTTLCQGVLSGRYNYHGTDDDGCKFLHTTSTTVWVKSWFEAAKAVEGYLR